MTGNAQSGSDIAHGFYRTVVDGLAELRPIALGVSATGLSFFNAGQLRLEASPTRRAMTMAGNRTPRVDKKVASILAEVLTA